MARTGDTPIEVTPVGPKDDGEEQRQEAARRAAEARDDNEGDSD